MTTRSWLALTAVGVASLAVHSMAPSEARACGGFFCSSSPIDQAGETIVYGLEDDGTLTMSVQIRYRGDDDDFAWILPVPAPPEISLGSDALFTELTRVTQPVFVTDYETRGTCREHPRCVYESGCGTASDGCGYGDFEPDPYVYDGPYVDAGASSSIDAGASDAGPRGDGVTVFSQGPVGPYETAVLGAATAAEVLAWLTEHGYDIPASSEPLLESYARGGQVFVALRLSSNADTRMLQPIVMRMPTAEACLPIRLTAIATVPDMPITAFFLGQERVTPWNYSSAVVDANDLGLWQGGRTWASEASRAVDALGGQAFVTDYAGPTPALSLELAAVDDLAAESDPALYLQALADRGYRGEARLLELLERYLEPPMGTAPVDYYNCLAIGSLSECGEPTSFDPSGLTAAIELQITAPRRDAHALVHRHNYLTRLYTTLSAEEMTIDPVFVPDAGLGNYSNVHRATLVIECSEDYFAEGAPRHWELGATVFERTVVEETAGELADDRRYCASIGGIPAYEAPTCSEPTSDGCSFCMVAGVAPMQGGVLGGLFLIFLVRRQSRKKH